MAFRFVVLDSQARLGLGGLTLPKRARVRGKRQQECSIYLHRHAGDLQADLLSSEPVPFTIQLGASAASASRPSLATQELPPAALIMTSLQMVALREGGPRYYATLLQE
jgi:hypothetical protein